MHYHKLWIGFVLLLAITSCTDPIDLKLDQTTEQLVVEGMITNESTQAPIKLLYTQPYTKEIGAVARKATNAYVYVSDQNNNQFPYYENEPGSYVPEYFTGQVGNTYTLHIITNESKEYESIPEKMLPTTNVEDMSAELRSRQVINEAGIESTEYAFQTFVNTSDPADEKNFYMWRWIGTYEVHTQPQDHTKDVRGTPVPDPLRCCAICWVTEGYQNIAVRNDALINGNAIIKQPIARLPILPENFNFKYHLQVKQYSLSESAFNFWRILTSQVTGVGSVQDPPPATIPGNIRNINDADDAVMGYFGVSAVSTRTMFINRDEVPFAISRYIYADDCRTLKNSTATKPDFW